MIALSNRKTIGWIVFILSVINLGFWGFVGIYALTTPADDEWQLLVLVILFFAIGGIINALLGIISGLFLAQSAVNKILGWFVFVVAIIGMLFTFVFLSWPHYGWIGLLELLYYVLLSIVGWLLSHSSKEELSIESN